MTRSIERRIAELEREDDEQRIILCDAADLDAVSGTAGKNAIIIVDDIPRNPEGRSYEQR